MFTGALSESSQTEVTIRDVDETAMDILIDFCYTSSIVVEENNVQTLLPAACLLQLAEIQDVCCEFLKRQLDPSNCLGIRAFAGKILTIQNTLGPTPLHPAPFQSEETSIEATAMVPLPWPAPCLLLLTSPATTQSSYTQRYYPIR